MKNRNVLLAKSRLPELITIVVMFLFSLSSLAQTVYQGVTFPKGDLSFADQVVSFKPGNGTGERDASAIIGAPDMDKQSGPSIIGGKGDVTLGTGGSVTIRFTNNYLIDVEGMDLYVYEAGPDTEPFKVEISTNGSNWIDLGIVRGQPTGLDIQSKINPGDKFQYVRLTATGTFSPRNATDIGKSLYSGSDIDAIGAIGTVFRPTGTITGIVKDKTTNSPIANATVSAGGIVTAKTNSSGKYTLQNVPAGMASVSVQSMNNGSANKSIDLPADATKTLDFSLVGDIIITGNQDCNGQGIYMYAEDRKGKKGSTVEMPVFICNVDDLANMDLNLNWNTSIAQLQGVKKGSATKIHMLQWNEVSNGQLKVAFAGSKGFNGSGSVAVLVYKLVGPDGSITQVKGAISTSNMSNGARIPIQGFDPGLLTISEPAVIGDCDGDDKLTERDALAALQIAVQKRPFDKCYDVNKDGKVDSQDARIIMRRIVGLPAL